MKESDTNCKPEHKEYPETPKRIFRKMAGVAARATGDKVPRWIKELSMASRGRLSAAHVIIRIGRDLYVTYQRDKITEETGGAISVDASPKSDPFSGKYSTVTYLFVNALLDSPLGKKIPGWAREALATVTDAHLVATGIVSVKQLKDSQRRLASKIETGKS